MKVAVIGGGIIGLCSAYYLKKAGHEVMVFDQGSLRDGCSFGNAGMVVPSHIVPLAAPGMLAKGVRWMFSSKSPFYVKPRLSPGLLLWGWQFYRHANLQHVLHAAPALKALSLFSKSMYQELAREADFDFGYQERGLLMLYQSAAAEHEEAEAVALAVRHGLDARVLSAAQVQALEPEITVKVRGGIFYPGDAHLTPHLLLRGLINRLKSQGVTLQTHVRVLDFDIDGGRVRAVRTPNGDFFADEFVLAAGAWSGRLARRLRLALPMQAGKGYGFSVPATERRIRIPSILLEPRVAVTPMGDTLRLGGTLEMAGINHTINPGRVRAIAEAVPSYYPELRVAMPPKEEIWHGLRPCSPDGLPYLGRWKPLKNVIIATGHAMMGLSLGPGTGKLVADLISQCPPAVPLEAFNPARFS